MKLRDRPPIPPLSSSTVANIERGVLAALERPEASVERPRPSRLVWALAPALLVIALLGWRDLRRGDPVGSQTTRVATAATGSHVAIRGAGVDVARHSAVAISDQADGPTLVVLERGGVTCEVAPRTGRAPFVVQAGSTRVTVVGTRFSVERRGDHAAVRVEHGLVRVEDDGTIRMVHAGEEYAPRAGEPPLAPTASAPSGETRGTPPPPAPPPAGAENTREASVPRAARPTRALALRTSDDGSRVIGPRRRLAPQEKPAKRALPTAENAVPAPETRTAPGLPATVAGPPASPTLPLEQQPPRLPAPRLTDQMSARTRFEAARGHEVSDPVGALRGYEELARGGDAWAANALFAAARLEAQRGQTARARELLDEYERRFPAGRNLEDARTLRRGLP